MERRGGFGRSGGSRGGDRRGSGGGGFGRGGGGGFGRGGGGGGGFNRDFDKPKPVKIGEEYDVVISDVGARGDGITKVENFIIFVNGAKKGEHCRIRIKEVANKFAIGEKVGAASEGSEESSSSDSEGSEENENQDSDSDESEEETGSSDSDSDEDQ